MSLWYFKVTFDLKGPALKTYQLLQELKFGKWGPNPANWFVWRDLTPAWSPYDFMGVPWSNKGYPIQLTLQGWDLRFDLCVNYKQQPVKTEFHFYSERCQIVGSEKAK